jgi:hypothetical protein
MTSAGIRSGVWLTKINMGTKASAIRPKVTQKPMRGLVLICVFMPYEMAWPTASRQRNAAPFRTLAVLALEYGDLGWGEQAQDLPCADVEKLLRSQYMYDLHSR